jgi:hypothetical protein
LPLQIKTVQRPGKVMVSIFPTVPSAILIKPRWTSSESSREPQLCEPGAHNGFIEGRDFVSFSVILENGGRRVDYYATIIMAKELATMGRHSA